jgi:hypothetical protein
MIFQGCRLLLVKSKYLFRDCVQVALEPLIASMGALKVIIFKEAIACIIGSAFSLIFGKLLNHALIKSHSIIIASTEVDVGITTDIQCYLTSTLNSAHCCIGPDIKGLDPSFCNLVGHPATSATFQIKSSNSLHLAQKLQPY